MDLLQAAVLGVVQGFTEFLPISSSGHLILVPWLFGWHEHGLVFDVGLHFGTLVALGAYYWRTWVELLARDRRLLGLLLAGCVPAGLIGFFGEKISEEFFRAPWQVGVGLIAFGLLLYAADRVGAKVRERDQLTLRDALLIGGAQGLAALFPGTSRSGITITAALLLGYQREAAATVSFLLATPITAAAVLWAGLRMVREPAAAVDPAALVVGIIASGIAGFLAIHNLLRYVRTRSYTPFVVYRLIVGVSILLLAITRG